MIEEKSVCETHTFARLREALSHIAAPFPSFTTGLDGYGNFVTNWNSFRKEALRRVELARAAIATSEDNNNA